MSMIPSNHHLWFCGWKKTNGFTAIDKGWWKHDWQIFKFLLGTLFGDHFVAILLLQLTLPCAFVCVYFIQDKRRNDRHLINWFWIREMFT